ncbi:hypothetical protein F981_01783 [Acinetobacter guillouiae CIP 63.46]|nr:hypothetical protein F981_01783 [Acinetobacter guillouiae CIP 63.46]
MSYYLLGFIFLALFTLSFWGLYTFLKKNILISIYQTQLT